MHGDKSAPVRVSARRDASQLTIAVSNAGTPIAAESQAGMFAPFWQRDESSRRGGLGLGLYICDQIVRAHGGTLAVSSTDAETRFTATLPVSA